MLYDTDFNISLHKMEFYKKEDADTIQVARINGPLLTRVTKRLAGTAYRGR
jgi:hypothetical protein